MASRRPPNHLILAISRQLGVSDLYKLTLVSKKYNFFKKISIIPFKKSIPILERAIKFYALPSWGLSTAIANICEFRERTFAKVEIITMAADRVHYASSYAWGECIIEGSQIRPIGIWKTNEDYQIGFNSESEFHHMWGVLNEGFILFNNNQIIDCSAEHDIDTLRDILPRFINI